MRNRIALIVIVIVLLLVGATGGWLLKSRSVRMETRSAENLSDQFLTYLHEKQNDRAYDLTSKSYRTATPKAEFDKGVAGLNDSSLQEGLRMVYKNGSSYLFVQSYLDKDGKAAKAVTISLYKDGKKLVITEFSVG